ncbi:MAG: DUF4411 family protein [Polaromonas sp.]|nr:DUF4411 family protein [Polaromonas sp.]MDP3752465.1 DUF4411 family protein [Polaromonas sp.]
MNTYVIDSNSLIRLGQFYPSRFPTLWQSIDILVASGRLISVKECVAEIESFHKDDAIKTWVKAHSKIFMPPTASEAIMVGEILKIPHFRSLISEVALLKGRPVADPFLVASAAVKRAIVVTEELEKPQAAKVPNVCKHFGVNFLTLEQMMELENIGY